MTPICGIIYSRYNIFHFFFFFQRLRLAKRWPSSAPSLPASRRSIFPHPRLRGSQGTPLTQQHSSKGKDGCVLCLLFAGGGVGGGAHELTFSAVSLVTLGLLLGCCPSQDSRTKQVKLGCIVTAMSCAVHG